MHWLKLITKVFGPVTTQMSSRGPRKAKQGKGVPSRLCCTGISSIIAVIWRVGIRMVVCFIDWKAKYFQSKGFTDIPNGCIYSFHSSWDAVVCSIASMGIIMVTIDPDNTACAWLDKLTPRGKIPDDIKCLLRRAEENSRKRGRDERPQLREVYNMRHVKRTTCDFTP